MSAQASLHLLYQAESSSSLVQGCVNDNLRGKQSNQQPANFAQFLTIFLLYSGMLRWIVVQM